MRNKVAEMEWSMGRSCDAPDCGRLVEGRGSFGLRAWLLGHRYCSDPCRSRVELVASRVAVLTPRQLT